MPLQMDCCMQGSPFIILDVIHLFQWHLPRRTYGIHSQLNVIARKNNSATSKTLWKLSVSSKRPRHIIGPLFEKDRMQDKLRLPHVSA